MYESVLVVVEPSHTSQNEMTLSQIIFPEILVIGSKEKIFRTICDKEKKLHNCLIREVKQRYDADGDVNGTSLYFE